MIHTYTYTVADMSCAHCKARIEKQVSQIPGVTEVLADPASKLLTVSASDTTLSSAIPAAVQEAGYTAVEA